MSGFINSDLTIHIKLILVPTLKQIPASTLSSTSTTYSGKSSADIFKQYIRRDPFIAPTVKDKQFNDQWKLSFADQARAQDVSAILDATYSPASPIDVAYFQEKQKYLYAVREAKAETAKGKSIIQKYESIYDAKEAALEAAHDADNTPDPPPSTTNITTKCDQWLTSFALSLGGSIPTSLRRPLSTTLTMSVFLLVQP
jgi:hypothetical protein